MQRHALSAGNGPGTTASVQLGGMAPAADPSTAGIATATTTTMTPGSSSMGDQGPAPGRRADLHSLLDPEDPRSSSLEAASAPSESSSGAFLTAPGGGGRREGRLRGVLREWSKRSQEWPRGTILLVLVGALAAAAVLAAVVAVVVKWAMSPGNGHAWVDWNLEPCSNLPVEIPDVATMTLEEKVAQLVAVPLPDILANGLIPSIANDGIGAIFARPGDRPPNGVNTPAEWRALTERMQAAAQRTRLRLPLLVGTELVHGLASVEGGTVFPHPIGLGAGHNADLMQLIGLAEAEELAAVGFRWAIGPTLSVCRDPRWGRCYECLSETERLVRLLNSQLDGLAGQRKGTGWIYLEKDRAIVAPTARYYLAEGGTMNGRSGANSSADMEDDAALRKMHLRPFFDALVRGVQMVQLGEGQVNGQAMANNSYLINILKLQEKFPGAIVSAFNSLDDTGGLLGNLSERVHSLVNAGVDLLLAPPGQYRAVLAALRDEVMLGHIAESRVDDAVQRVLRVKKVTGHFASPCKSIEEEEGRISLELIGSKRHRNIARNAAMESLVLLKNGGGDREPIFPIRRRHLTFYVLGSHSDDLGRQCGGYTLTMQGSSGSIPTEGTTIAHGLRLLMWPSSQVIHLGMGERINLRGEPPYPPYTFAVLVIGEEPYAGAEGDRSNGNGGSDSLTISPDMVDLVLDSCAKVRCVVILVTGRPLDVSPIINYVDALVVAWLPGSEGGLSVADLMLGPEVDFRGTLPLTWFRNASQLPINYGDEAYDPLFPYGFGMTKNNTRLNGTFVSLDGRR